MIQPINKNQLTLAIKSKPATKNDIHVADDLRDTLTHHRSKCVGMAANMIGKPIAIIVFVNELGIIEEMFNPSITFKSEKYSTSEGCLSLKGVRTTFRYKNITVKYQDRDFKEHTRDFSGFVAQIIQHEIDHLNGIII